MLIFPFFRYPKLMLEKKFFEIYEDILKLKL